MRVLCVWSVLAVLLACAFAQTTPEPTRKQGNQELLLKGRFRASIYLYDSSNSSLPDCTTEPTDFVSFNLGSLPLCHIFHNSECKMSFNIDQNNAVYFLLQNGTGGADCTLAVDGDASAEETERCTQDNIGQCNGQYSATVVFSAVASTISSTIIVIVAAFVALSLWL